MNDYGACRLNPVPPRWNYKSQTTRNLSSNKKILNGRRKNNNKKIHIYIIPIYIVRVLKNLYTYTRINLQ